MAEIKLTHGGSFAGEMYGLWLNGKGFKLLGPVGGSAEDEIKARKRAVEIIQEQTGEIVNLDNIAFNWDGCL